MKRLIILVALFYFISPTLLVSQDSQDSIVKGKVNITILKLNYLDYSFEGGHTQTFDCLKCTNDSIPLQRVQKHKDFYYYCLLLPNGDTVMDYSVVWMGTGNINYPDTFYLTPPFTSNLSNHINKPNSYQAFHSNNIYSVYTPLFDSIWKNIKRLDIVKTYTDYNYKLGIFVWNPTAGGGSTYSASKYIVFLYYNDIQVGIEEEQVKNTEPIKIYPNPSNDYVFVESKEQIFTIQIHSLDGRLIMEQIGGGNIKLDIQNLPKGMYIISGRNTKGKSTFQKKLIKL